MSKMVRDVSKLTAFFQSIIYYRNLLFNVVEIENTARKKKKVGRPLPNFDHFKQA